MQKTVSQGFRLSPQQEHVWLAQGGESAHTFVVQLRVDIAGTLDRARLAGAVEKVVDRHEILRTTYPLLPSLSVPVQSVEDSAAGRVEWRELSLAGQPATEPEEALGTLWSEAREMPFDLANGPLLRATLVELETGNGERHALLLTQPALAADGTSLELLAAEVAATYHGRPAKGEVLQYADLAEILHDWQGAPAGEPGPTFWRQQDFSALVRPRRRRASQSGPRHVRPEQVSRGLGRAAVEVAAAQNATSISVVLLAAWHATLHLSTGEEEIVVGALFDGRTCAELEDALGPFARYLPVRARSSTDATLAEMFHDLAAATAEISRRQDFFSSESIAKLLDEHGASGWPFGFDVWRRRELPTAPDNPPGGPAFSTIGGHLELDRFGLRLSVFDDGRTLRAGLVYDPATHERDDAERLLDRFSRVLDGLLAGLPVGAIDVLTAAERRRVLAFNRTEVSIPPDLCAHHLFEETVARTPHAPAVLSGEGTWTYAELNARSNLIAHRLRAAGVGPGSLVGVCLDPSPDLVAAVLGILQSGAAYVPLDSGLPAGLPAESPAERLSWMAEDAGLALLLTQDHIRILLDDRLAEPLEEDRRERSTRSADPTDLAYVIYTSGSTGRPKGVMIPHRALVNYLLWARQAYAAAEGRGAPLHSAIGFDLTVTSLLVPLGAGTAVHLPAASLDESHPAEALITALRENADFSLVKLTPAHLDVLSRELSPGEYDGRTRALVIGGEALRSESIAPWREHAPRTRLINEYGPTEATVGCCVYESAPDDAPVGPVPIGRPIANTRLYVAGPRLQQVPLGAPGELCIGGDGLARGYLGRPDLTAERFVPDPFGAAAKPGERLYRTGDLVRLRPEGELEVLGRIDDQIKIRGFRIEPGEIEAALAAHGKVREAVVLAAEDPAGNTVLVACVAGQTGAGELRAHLSSRLPEPMMPSRYAFFEALPLTPNGKVDRRELARTWREKAESNTESSGGEAARTWTEELLAGMFAELLHVPRVGRSESFFALGGHSLLATQAVSRVREAFGVEMTLRGFFEAPTVSTLAARIEALRSQGDGPGLPARLPAITAMPRNGPPPLSFAQQRLWFIDQLQPGSPLYNIPVALRVEGPLDAALLARSLGEIVRRHEVLRTVFAGNDGNPVQVILPPAPFPLAVADFSGLPESRREAPARALAGDEAGRSFDLSNLSQGPLLRGLLVRLAAHDHVVAVTMHHIASDGWSMGILVRELTVLYGAWGAGRPSPLPELPVQYADFAVWQASWLHGEALDHEISFWRRQLAGLPPRLELPTDRPRPAVQSFRGSTRDLRLPSELARQAQALSRREGATLFMVLLAGFQTLLARTTGQDDFAVGTPVAGRNRLEIEGLIGFFVNTLVLRGDLTGDPSLRQLLRRVRETALAAHMHQDLPFEKLIQELTPERSLAQTPLFQMMFVLQNAPAESLEIQDLRLRPVPSPATTAKFEITWSLAEHDGGISGTVEYATDLFDAATVDRLIACYERLLTAALTAPELQVSELQAVFPAERHQVLTEWNDTAVEPDETILIHELFETWAARTPDTVAAVCGREVLTYGELENRAHRLARHLARLGIGPGALVGVHLRRSLDMLQALLAVLQAGAAYVPLEIGHPPARLHKVLAALDISCLLTEEAQLPAVDALQAGLPGLRDVVCLDRSEQGPKGQQGHQGRENLRPCSLWSPLGPLLPGDALAYVIFTSGSTGAPKGVMVRHRPVVNLIRWAHRAFAFSPADRVLFITSLSFDLSVFDVFGLLAAGGSIRIATDEEVRDPERLLQALAEEPITFWDSAPAALEQTVPFLPDDGGAALRLVFLSGDWIPVSLPDRLRCRFPQARIVALGGATEATVWSNVFPLGTVEPWWTSIPYGRPIDNARYHVLDARLGPCPIGVAGDLHIGGGCLADGYARMPEVTAEKFLPDPWGPPGARLYSTGDRARYRPDGTLEFLGRRDTQVKIRGFRIELGEIEAALSSLPGVREAVVLAREDMPGDRRLVAYVVGETDSDALRRSLRERLPAPMVPSAFVTLAALPLTPNGKVDRKGLPAPERQSGEETYRAPRTPVEEALAGIWAEILGLERVGAADHFFELGGHSLLATRLLAAVRERFRLDLPLRLVFERPTLEGMAQAISEAGEAEAPDDPIVALPREPGENRFPVSFSQLREWILDRLEPGNPAYNIANPLRIEGPLAVPLLAHALWELVRRHEVFRTRFAAGEEEPFQVVLPEARLDLPLIDLSSLPDRERQRELRRQAERDAATGFDLAAAPLLRTRIVRLAPDDHALLLTVHHIIADGWSMGILNREVAALYQGFSPLSRRGLGREMGEGPGVRALSRGSDSDGAPLPPLSVQYADYATWQRRRLTGELLERQVSFWRQRLGGAPPLLELPTDRPRPPVRGNRGGTVPFHLPARLADGLQELAHRSGTTLFMVVLAAYQALLGRWSGQDEVVVGTYDGKRPRRELEGLIGFFINTLVLRTSLAEGLFNALLARVRETTLDAFDHSDIPFEKLLAVLEPPRDPSRTPLFQALLVLQNLPAARAELSRGVRLTSLAVSDEKADYDLELWLGEQPDGIAGAFKYSAVLFDRATIDRFAGQLRTLLESVAAAPNQDLRTLPLMTAAEQDLVLATWSRGPAVPPGEPLLHRLVEEQAAGTPDAVAVDSGGLFLTCAGLMDRARHEALALEAQGVGRGSIVALDAERASDLIVSMLAVLQVGGAYLPIDPAYPRERRDFMVQDSGATFIPDPPSPGVGVRGDGRGGQGVRALCEDDAAYVIYTSGSTGLPKGVVVPHRAISSFVRTARESYGITASDRVLQFASLSFDTSAEEIWPALASGATVVLRPTDMAESIPHFLRELSRLAITMLDLPTAFWHELVAGIASLGTEAPELPRELRLVILGGEEALADRLTLWNRRTGASVRLINTYGPTEATIVATRRELADVAPGARVPIGRPIAGARTYVLDRLLAPVPPGVRGELWIGGAGVARGYLGRPGPTAERFAPDPFADSPGARLYRTGDLAVLRPDGDLHFAGRADRQVKLRGYRIEPGEIEAALRLHPAIHNAAVDVRGGEDDRRLVAWVAARQNAELPGAAELRAFLRERLPEPMVPAVFAPVPALPLTASGKVDRRALSEPAPRSEPTASYVEPGTAIERMVAAIFRDLLRVDRVSLNDNFFDLGGHSLLVIRAHQKLREALGREIPVVDLFRFPTVALLARRLSQRPDGQEEKPSFRKVQDLAGQQRAAQLRQKQVMNRWRKPGGRK